MTGNRQIKQKQNNVSRVLEWYDNHLQLILNSSHTPHTHQKKKKSLLLIYYFIEGNAISYYCGI